MNHYGKVHCLIFKLAFGALETQTFFVMAKPLMLWGLDPPHTPIVYEFVYCGWCVAFFMHVVNVVGYVQNTDVEKFHEGEDQLMLWTAEEFRSRIANDAYLTSLSGKKVKAQKSKMLIVYFEHSL